MSYLSDFEHTKLDAHVFPGMVVEMLYISDATTGQRRVPQTRIWNVERLLGKGGFGEVRLETRDEEKRAVKRIWETGMTFKVAYERELKALLEFSKPKYKESAVFVGFLGWFQDPESVYLAMEYVPLGDLEDNVVKMGGKIGEGEVKEIAVQILEGLKIMHLESFVHRDLKPKSCSLTIIRNVLVCRGSPEWWVKLADFGLSKRRTEDTAFRTQTGTQAYMAPEILNYIPGHSEYTYAVDIWALGCILYRLTTGTVPFPPGLSLTSFCVDESKFPQKALHISDSGKEFIRKLIVAHPSKRLTSEEALDHEWTKPEFKTVDESLGELIAPNDSTAKDSLESFGGYNTDTHGGLQSQGNGSSAHTAVHITSNSPPKPPSIRYHKPTVEDELEPEIEGKSSVQLAETQVLQSEDIGTPGGQESDPIDRDIRIKPPDRKGETNKSSYSDRDFNTPKRPSEIWRVFDEHNPQDPARTPSRKSPDMTNQPPEAEGPDEDEWGFLPANSSQEDEQLSSSYDTDCSKGRGLDADSFGGRNTHLKVPIRNGPYTSSTPERTQYVIENGKTVPLVLRKSPIEKEPSRYIIDKRKKIPIRRQTTPARSQETKPIIGKGRSIRSRSTRRDAHLYQDDAGGLFSPLTVDNLRKHDDQTEPLRKPPPTFGMTSDFSFKSHSHHTSTRKIAAGREFQRSRSPSHRRSTESTSKDKHERSSFYANEHGFVERAPSPPPVLRKQEQSAYDKKLFNAFEYVKNRLRTDNTDRRSRQRYSNRSSESVLDGRPEILRAKPKTIAGPSLQEYENFFSEPVPDDEPIFLPSRPTARPTRGETAYFDNVRYKPKYTTEDVIYSTHAAGIQNYQDRGRDRTDEDLKDYTRREPTYF